MGGGFFRPLKWNRVLIDVCTQRDFLESGAILQVTDTKELIPRIKQVFQWAKSAGVPVVSSIESHRTAEPPNGFPLHCVDGTPGQQKVYFTILSPHIVVETDNYLSLPAGLHEHYRQLIFRKRTREVLSNPKADRFLTQLAAEEFIIFGVGLERAIKSLALGLRARYKKVTVISDACGYWSAGDADLALRQLAAKNIKLVTIDELSALETIHERAILHNRSARRRHNPVRSTPARRSRRNTANK